MSEEQGPRKIECVLCRKPKQFTHQFKPGHNEISAWSKVCNDCVAIWEIGKKTMAATKTDGKEVEATAHIEVPEHLYTKMGDPIGAIAVRGKDIMTAIGGISLRGTAMGNRWRSAKREVIHITSPQDENDISYVGGGSLDFKVPKGRADAMKRVIGAFYNAVAKARVDGFNEGRNLLAGLAKGDISLDSFSEQADNARVGKKPKKRWDD